MAITVALVCIVIFTPAANFSQGGNVYKLMTFGIKTTSERAAVIGGTDGPTVMSVSSTLSICTAAVLGLAALVPLVSIFLFRRRQLQARLLGAEFALLLGGAGLLAWYVWSTYRGLVEGESENYYFSFIPLLTVAAMLTNWFAIRGVLRDEIMVRAADRIR